MRYHHNALNDKFYESPQWRKTRNAYASSRHWLCERCLKQGIVKRGEIVHHKQHLNAYNVHDPAVAFGVDNLELLCLECHNAEHDSLSRYKLPEARCGFDADGMPLPKGTPPGEGDGA